jgi:HlyD family secretion protein
MKFNRRIVLLLILILAVIVIFLPIKVNYSFNSTALVFSSKEWNLKRGADDSYISELMDNETNVISKLMSYKFERGDVAEVHILRNLTSGDFVKANDTVAFIHSFFIENEIIRLKNLKQIEEAALRMTIAGEKQTLIDQAKQRQEFALQQLDLALKNYERQRDLYLDSIIPKAEFDIYENQFQLAKINVEIVKKELLTVETGAKVEELDYIRQKAESYDREIKTLEKMKEQYYIKTPLGGLVNFNRMIDGILSVSDTSRFILKIPVKINNIQYLDRISGIQFSIPGYNQKMEATFINIDENVNLNLTTNQQMLIAKALIGSGNKGIYPGMAVSCQVYCDKITIFDFLRRGIHLKL